MSELTVKKTLVKQLSDTITDVQIAHENSAFNPKGLDSFLAFFYFPNTAESLGKSLLSGDWNEGFFQVSIFVKENADNLDIECLTLAERVKAGFRNTTVLNHYGLDVFIKETTSTNGAVLDGWFKKDLTIYYAVIEAR